MANKKRKVVLAVHGGAGIILRSQLPPEKEAQFRSALKDAMAAGYAKLMEDAECRDNESPSEVAADAVEAAVRCLEDCPLFNAGRGSVLSNDEKIRMDASIMACSTDICNQSSRNTSKNEERNAVFRNQFDSKRPPHKIVQKIIPTTPQSQAGAVAGVQHIKNPVSLARAVMERTPHVMLIGKGAEEFAQTLPGEAGVEIQDDEYFWTERRWNQLMDVREREAKQQQHKVDGTKIFSKDTMKVQLDHASEYDPNNLDHDRHKFGTVGCVALYLPSTKSGPDNAPNRTAQLAAATSTGGMTNQRYNRVGDSPIIGAGTYANHLCAVSCTGHGEHFIRCVAAHDIAKRMEYKHGFDGTNSFKDENEGCHALYKAAEEVIFGTLMGNDKEEGGDGGVIALDRNGNLAATMNCPGMYHGWVYEDGEMETRIFSDE